ncbi:MAG: LysE family translocator [Chloroflexi bacterium]|nr:LysE family translocator [Chloroflexota bacterium]
MGYNVGLPEMPTLVNLIPRFFSFAVGFGAVITPGPVSTTIVSQSPRSGWRVGPLVSTGHALMELAVVLLISLGLSTILAHSTIQIIIALVGGILLAGMGGGMIFSVLRGNTHLPGVTAGVQAMAPRQMVALGVIATVTNPFWYAWWVTVAAGYLAQAQALGFASVAAFYLGHIAPITAGTPPSPQLLAEAVAG